MYYANDVRDRLAMVASVVGWEDPNDYSQAEKDQQNALVRDLDRQVERYPVVHAWRTDKGSGLVFWCKYCKSEHTHGRHHGPGRFAEDDNVVQLRTTPDGRIRRIPGMARLWKKYVLRHEQCMFNPNRPGGRGVCTCPMGSGDGHRSTHCTSRNGEYFKHGYFLHEVEPNDARATRKPNERGRKDTN
jgi:hypothetical protein